jgi:pheromone shutdown protein TraB
VDREELTKIPPPSLLSIVLKWAIPMLVLGGFLWGFTHGTLVPMGRAWVLCTSVVCALFTLLAGARPLSILTAAVAAPVASLSPLVSVGTLTGLIEAWLRKPTASDRERVILDVLSLRGLYRNRATRVLLVTLAASIGGRLGAWIGAAWVVALLRH